MIAPKLLLARLRSPLLPFLLIQVAEDFGKASGKL